MSRRLVDRGCHVRDFLTYDASVMRYQRMHMRLKVSCRDDGASRVQLRWVTLADDE